LEHYQDAVTACTTCVTLAPQSAPCYFNRALAHAVLGRTDRALHDYDRALHYDPTLAAAALNRGILHYREMRYDAALVDLKRAVDCGADTATANYNMALVYVAKKDHATALTCVQRALQHNPQHRPACALQARLLGKE
jgi:tetratricopeptide (TPR) repeat protein